MAHQPVGASARQDLFGGPSRAATSRSSAGPSGRGTPFTSDYDGKEGKEDDRPNSGLVSGPTKIGDDIMELEHAMGYTGHFLNTIATHPSNPTLYARTLGSVLVISDLDNPHESHYLKGHDMEITCIDISPSGDLIASGQVGSTHYKGYHAPVIVWDFQTKEKVFVLEGVTGGALGARFSPDGAFLAAWGRDGLLYVWDLRTGEVAYGKRYPSPLGIFQWVSISREGRRPTYQVVLSREAEVALHTLAFDAASRQWTFAGAPVALPGAGLVREYLSSCAASAGGGEYVAAGTTVGDLAVFNARNAVYRASLPVAGGGLTAVLSGPGGAGALYCGAGDGTVKRVRGEDLRWQLEAEVSLGARVTGLAAAAAGAELVVGTAGGSVFRVDAETLAARPVHDSHTAGVRAVAFPRDRSDVFATAAEDGSVVVWDLNDYSVVCRAGSLRSGGANCLGWVGEAEVVVGFEDAAVRAYQVDTGARAWEIPGAHRAPVTCLAVHADDRMGFLVTGAADGAVRVWALRSREMLLQFAEHKKGVSAVLVDLEQPHLVHSAGLDCAVFTYDIQRERRTVCHMVREGAFLAMTQRRDSEKELVTCDAAGRLLGWDCDVPDPVQALQDPSRQRVCAAAVSPSGKFLAIGGQDQLVKVLDMQAEGDIISAGHGHSAGVRGLAWSPDERQLVSVGDDCSICIWNFYGPP